MCLYIYIYMCVCDSRCIQMHKWQKDKDLFNINSTARTTSALPRVAHSSRSWHIISPAPYSHRRSSAVQQLSGRFFFSASITNFRLFTFSHFLSSFRFSFLCALVRLYLPSFQFCLLACQLS